MLFFYPILFVIGFLPATIMAALLMRVRLPVAIMVTAGILAISVLLLVTRMDAGFGYLGVAWCLQIPVLLPCYRKSREAKALGKSRARQWAWVSLGSFICLAAWGPVAAYLGRQSW